MDFSNRSFSVTAEVAAPEDGVEGVVIAQGKQFGGWVLYVKDGVTKFAYHTLGLQEDPAEATRPAPGGRVRVKVKYGSGGPSKATATLDHVDGQS